MKQDVNQRVIAFFRSRHQSMNAFAKEIGVNSATANNYLSQGRDCSLDFICTIIDKFPSLSAEWLLRGNGTMEAAPETTTPEKSEEKMPVDIMMQKLIDTVQSYERQLAAKHTEIERLKMTLTALKEASDLSHPAKSKAMGDMSG